MAKRKRRKPTPERFTARFKPGTIDAMDAAAFPNESLSGFVRQAVARELFRRKKNAGNRMTFAEYARLTDYI